MLARGLAADEQLRGDLRIGQALGQQLKHLALASRQVERDSLGTGQRTERAGWQRVVVGAFVAELRWNPNASGQIDRLMQEELLTNRSELSDAGVAEEGEHSVGGGFAIDFSLGETGDPHLARDPVDGAQQCRRDLRLTVPACQFTQTSQRPGEQEAIADLRPQEERLAIRHGRGAIVSLGPGQIAHASEARGHAAGVPDLPKERQRLRRGAHRGGSIAACRVKPGQILQDIRLPVSVAIRAPVCQCLGQEEMRLGVVLLANGDEPEHVKRIRGNFRVLELFSNDAAGLGQASRVVIVPLYPMQAGEFRQCHTAGDGGVLWGVGQCPLQPRPSLLRAEHDLPGHRTGQAQHAIAVAGLNEVLNAARMLACSALARGTTVPCVREPMRG